MNRGLLIAGSREVDPAAVPIIEQMVEFGFKWFENRIGWKFDHVIEGGARGVDRIARNWAEKNGLLVRTMEADWERYGKGAGPIRNQDMAKVALAAVLIWDGKSRGTADMLDRVMSRPIPYVVYPLVRVPQQEVLPLCLSSP